MKGLFLILFLLSQCANAWQASSCSGTKKQRKEALIDLVQIAQSYKVSHNKVPDPTSQYDEEFMNLIPKILNGSLIHVGIQDVDIEYQSVSYACDLKKKNKTEICEYLIKTKEVHCSEIKPPEFNPQGRFAKQPTMGHVGEDYYFELQEVKYSKGGSTYGDTKI